MESNTNKHTNKKRRRPTVRVRARNRLANPIPFWERVLNTITETVNHTTIGRRKILQFIDEGRVETTTIDQRRYVITESLKRVIDAGRGVQLREPPHLQRRHTEGVS